jgi:hypothetical protein
MGRCRDHPRRHPFGLDRFASSLASRRTKPHLKPCTTAQDRGHRRHRPSPRRPSPTCDRGRPMGTDDLDQRGGVALRSIHGGPGPPRWSTGHVMLAPALRQRQSTLPRRLPLQFYKKNPALSNITYMPFHLQRFLQFSPGFHSEAPEFLCYFHQRSKPYFITSKPLSSYT